MLGAAFGHDLSFSCPALCLLEPVEKSVCQGSSNDLHSYNIVGLTAYITHTVQPDRWQLGLRFSVLC